MFQIVTVVCGEHRNGLYRFPLLFPKSVLCFSVDREIPNELHTSTPEFNFFYIDDLASDVLPY